MATTTYRPRPALRADTRYIVVPVLLDDEPVPLIMDPVP